MMQKNKAGFLNEAEKIHINLASLVSIILLLLGVYLSYRWGEYNNLRISLTVTVVVMLWLVVWASSEIYSYITPKRKMTPPHRLKSRVFNRSKLGIREEYQKIMERTYNEKQRRTNI